MRIVLERVSATAGYLERAGVRFAPGLNCIIGSRGTCKSTLVESIRFAFDSDPDKVAKLVAASGRESRDGRDAGLIAATLGAGCVACDVRDTDAAETYRIERELGGPPRVYREGVREQAEGPVRSRIEIYSQGDLQRIAEDAVLRLQLIDRPNFEAVDSRRREQRAVAGKLMQVGPQIRELRARAAQLRENVRALDDLRLQLEAIRRDRPQLSRELDDRRAAHLRRQEVSRAVSAGVAAVGAAAAELSAVRRRLDELRDAVGGVHRSGLVDHSPEVKAVYDLLTGAGIALRKVLDDAGKLSPTGLPAATEAMTRAFAAADEPYYALRKQEQQANESLKREDVLSQQIAALEAQARELADTETKLTRLVAERSELRTRMGKLADEIYQLRAEQVDLINRRHGELVILSLDQGGQSLEYEGELTRLLAGSRLRNREELARDLARALPPGELVDIVEAGDANRLASLLGRDPAQTGRLLTYLTDSPDLYRLEGQVFEDRLNITMYDNGVPKPVSTLSKGQKATALLPLILRSAPYPLIFDQPEDDLDNRFIFHSLVRTVRELKTQRQLIFVTHNANIPVIGEADAVVVMRMDSPEKAGEPSVGTVDERQKDIIDLLEGGAEAFRERGRRYHVFGAAPAAPPPPLPVTPTFPPEPGHDGETDGYDPADEPGLFDGSDRDSDEELAAGR